jgi:hypothetical protein
MNMHRDSLESRLLPNGQRQSQKLLLLADWGNPLIIMKYRYCNSSKVKKYAISLSGGEAESNFHN